MWVTAWAPLAHNSAFNKFCRRHRHFRGDKSEIKVESWLDKVVMKTPLPPSIPLYHQHHHPVSQSGTACRARAQGALSRATQTSAYFWHWKQHVVRILDMWDKGHDVKSDHQGCGRVARAGETNSHSGVGGGVRRGGLTNYLHRLSFLPSALVPPLFTPTSQFRQIRHLSVSFALSSNICSWITVMEMF